MFLPSKYRPYYKMGSFGWPLAAWITMRSIQKGLKFPDQNDESEWWEYKQHKLKPQGRTIRTKGQRNSVKLIQEESHLLKWFNNTTKRAVPSRGQP